MPNISDRPSLNWWQKTEEGPTSYDVTLYCTICGCEQRLEWYHELKYLLDKIRQSDARRRMYQIFKSLEKILLGYNDARAYISLKLCSEWFKLPYRKYLNIVCIFL